MAQSRVAERVLILVGGILMVVSPFVPWVSVILLGSLGLFHLLDAANASAAFGYVPIVGGLAIVLVELLARRERFSRLVCLGLALLVMALGADLFANLLHAVHQSNGFASLEFGPFAMGAGGLLVASAALVGLLRPPISRDGSVRVAAPVPRWVPWAVGIPIVLALTLTPLQAGDGTACGSALVAISRSQEATPRSTPPADVQARLTADQQSLTTAQTALAQQQAQDQAAANQQSSAQDLSNQASQAQSDASGAALSVSGDQNTVQSDQSTIAIDQANITNDQQNVQNDLTSGSDPTFDQQTLANDQATLTRDQQTLSSDQATLATDQAMAAALQAKADSLTNQANQAQSQANSSSQSSSAADQTVQQAVTSAQSQLDSDQQAWQTSYNTAVNQVNGFNTFANDCADQASPRVTLGALLIIPVLIIWAVLQRRHRARNANVMQPPAERVT